MTRPVRAFIDLQALQANLQRVREVAPVSRVMAVVKADGYGHGGVRVARALDQADAFGVASLEEAIALRDAGIRHRVVLLEGFFSPDELDLVVHHGLDVVVHNASQLETLERTRITPLLQVWVKIDTGMHRLGFAPEQVPDVVRRLQAASSVKKPLRFMSHLACADEAGNEYTAQQQDRFLRALGDQQGECSMANSAGILGWPATHMDWVRPGIMLYGASPFAGGTGQDSGLRPAMTFSTRLISVSRRRKGDRVGYGGEWVCPEDMPVGTAAVGYGDGYPRHAPQGTPVLIGDRRAPLVGRVSMDMITIDLRGVPDARVGDPVELWGPRLPVEELAAASGTIAYELLCGVSARVFRDSKP